MCWCYNIQIYYTYIYIYITCYISLGNLYKTYLDDKLNFDIKKKPWFCLPLLPLMFRIMRTVILCDANDVTTYSLPAVAALVDTVVSLLLMMI